MEKFPNSSINTQIHKPEKQNDLIFERVTNHSSEFDKDAEENRVYTKNEIRDHWQTKEWKIGETTIQALGVNHTPETFLEYRSIIEKTIFESDVVVNEFSPEILGFYNKDLPSNFKNKKSKFNPDYSLEDLKQFYIKNSRSWELGEFHHEIELLSAKYNKDIALMDLSWSKEFENLLEDDYFFTYELEKAKEKQAKNTRDSLYSSSATLGIASIISLVNDLKKPMSRRNFIRTGIMASISLAIAGVTPLVTKLPDINETELNKGNLRGMLRDPKIADSLRKLSNLGYKKIAFIYGAQHLEGVEKYLKNTDLCDEVLNANKNFIEGFNPDAFRVYRVSDGENKSEKFVASDKKVWKRLPL